MSSNRNTTETGSENSFSKLTRSYYSPCRSSHGEPDDPTSNSTDGASELLVSDQPNGGENAQEEAIPCYETNDGNSSDDPKLASIPDVSSNSPSNKLFEPFGSDFSAPPSPQFISISEALQHRKILPNCLVSAAALQEIEHTHYHPSSMATTDLKRSTVKISGFVSEPVGPTLQALRLRIEDAHRGGGPYKSLKFKTNLTNQVYALVTFESESTAGQFVETFKMEGNLIGEQELVAELFKTPPILPKIDKRTFVLTRLTESLTDDVLQAHLEGMLTSESEDVCILHRSASKDRAIIRFRVDKDVSWLQDALNIRGIGKTRVKAEANVVRKPNAIYVFNLAREDKPALEAFEAFLSNQARSDVRDDFEMSWDVRLLCWTVRFYNSADARRALVSMERYAPPCKQQLVAFAAHDYLEHAIPRHAIVPAPYNATEVYEMEFDLQVEDSWPRYFELQPGALQTLQHGLQKDLKVVVKLSDSKFKVVCALSFNSSIESEELVVIEEWVQQVQASLQNVLRRNFRAMHVKLDQETMDELHRLESDDVDQVRMRLLLEENHVELRGPTEAVKSRIDYLYRTIASDAHNFLAIQRLFYSELSHVTETCELHLYEKDYLHEDEEFRHNLQSGAKDEHRVSPIKVEFPLVAASESGKVSVTLRGKKLDVIRAKRVLTGKMSGLIANAQQIELDSPLVFLLTQDVMRKKLREAFRRQNLVAVWHADLTGINDSSAWPPCVNLIVYSSSPSNTATAVSTILSSIERKVVKVNATQLETTRSQWWQQFAIDLNNIYDKKIIVQVDSNLQAVLVYTLSDCAQEVVSRIEKFLVDNTIIHHTIELPLIKVQFMKQFLETELHTLLSKLCQNGTFGYFYTAEQPHKHGISFRGNQREVEEAVVLIKATIDSIQEGKVQFANVLVKRWLMQEKNAETLCNYIATKHKCVIDRFDVPEIKQLVPVGASCLLDRQYWGARIVVCNTDVIKYRADILLSQSECNLARNSFNKLRRFVIGKAGEGVIQDCVSIKRSKQLYYGEIAVTSAGDLQTYKKIVHAVIPKHSINEEDVHQYIRSCTLEALKVLEDSSMVSIVLPSFESEEHCKTALKAVQEAVSQRNLINIEVHFVDKNNTACRRVINVVRLLCCEAASLGQSASSCNQTDAFNDTLTMPNGMNVKLEADDILKQVADVVVNNTSSDLNLQRGQISKKLLSSCGRVIQDEARKELNNKGLTSLPLFTFVATSTGQRRDLRKILHTTLPKWTVSNNTDVENKFKQNIVNMLKYCVEQRYTSIAIPALGTGALKYPGKIVAKWMYEAASEFDQQGATCLKQVKVICYYDDQPTFGAFLEELRSWQLRSVASSGQATKISSPKRSQSTNSSNGDLESVVLSKRRFSHPSFTANWKEAQIGQCEVQIVDGDLTKQTDVQALINFIDEDSSNKGSPSSTLIRAGGLSFRKEVVEHLQKLRCDEVVVTHAGDLPVQFVIQVIAPEDFSKWPSLVKRFLEEAELKQVRSIAIPYPALGTDTRSNIIASTMLDTIAAFAVYQKPANLHLIRICGFHSNLNGLRTFENELEKKLIAAENTRASHTASSLNWIRRNLDQSTESESGIAMTSGVDKDPVSLVLCSSSIDTFKVVSDEVEKLVQDQVTKRTLHYPSLFNAGYRSKVNQIVDRYGVICEINEHLQQIMLHGLQNDCLQAENEINRLIESVKESRLKEERATLLYQLTRWQIEEGHTFYDYDKFANFIIEEAYVELNRSTVKLQLENGDELEIDLEGMVEVEKQTGKKRRVRRRKLTSTGLHAETDNQ